MFIQVNGFEYEISDDEWAATVAKLERQRAKERSGFTQEELRIEYSPLLPIPTHDK